MGGYEIVRDIPNKGSHLLVASTCETAMMKGEPNHAYSDACLIAAAPDLLAALKNALGGMCIGEGGLYGSSYTCGQDVIDEIRAAIAKTEGVARG